mmetsp:Transcript_29139/g.55047  ORF Transcript_29139/g.55047 Transcript_29139/m.55047 type:complete len:201 (+) Transcript_29139:1397-1999(+)
MQVGYRFPLFSCLNDMRVCCFTAFCPCIVMGQAQAIVQDRNCDTLDCLSHFTIYELRKSVKVKYNLYDAPETHACGKLCQPVCTSCANCFNENPQDVTDACCAFWCGCCMVCQDYRELQGYHPNTPSVHVSSTTAHIPTYGSAVHAHAVVIGTPVTSTSDFGPAYVSASAGQPTAASRYGEQPSNSSETQPLSPGMPTKL